MDLTPSALAVFKDTALFVLGVLAVACAVDLLSFPTTGEKQAQARHLLALGWSAAPLVILAALLAAITGVSLGL